MESDVRVVLVSDTHNVEIDAKHVPCGDLLLHAGDHTVAGTREELARAAAWLGPLAKRYQFGCVTIGGNHDLPLDSESFRPWQATTGAQTEAPMGATLGRWDVDEIRDAPAMFAAAAQVRLLQHESAVVAGLTIFGSPYVPLTPSKQKLQFGDPRRSLGFNRDDATLAELYYQVPPETDILMTHGPPFGLLDASHAYGGQKRAVPISIGSRVLRERLNTLRPALHVFGHEHDSRGVLVVDGADLRCTFVNAAAVEGDRGVLQQGGRYVLKRDFVATVVDFRLDSGL